tara:strand:+ start:119 stop:631 length:513 start_codon:yes stop_codon:yes gene_type:complete
MIKPTITIDHDDMQLAHLLNHCCKVVCKEEVDYAIYNKKEQIDIRDVKSNRLISLDKPLKLNDLFSVFSGEVHEGIMIGGISFNPIHCTISCAGEELELTEKESQLLQYLALNRSQEITKETLLEDLWDIKDDEVESHTLQTHIYRLRQKLDSLGGQDLLQTTEGGYTVK